MRAIILHYSINCFLLLIPVLIWNALLYKRLPAGYQKEKWDKVPGWIKTAEAALRFPVFILPVFLKLEITTEIQLAGLILYISGIAVYFFSWVLQIYFPKSAVSKTRIAFTAPAWTTALWLAGIGLTGRSLTLDLPYSSIIYIIILFCFVSIHSVHAYLAQEN
jgi:hypothetical protein